MKVWMNKRYEDYGGGMILVAANTAEEAHEALMKDENLCYLGKDVPYYGITYFPGNWQEMPMLEARVDKPQVLAEEGYTE